MYRSLCGPLACMLLGSSAAVLSLAPSGIGSWRNCRASSQMLCNGLQAPELYAMAMAAAGALGVTEVPELWLQSSAQAAVHYLRMPLRRFHGLDGDLGFAVSALHSSRKSTSAGPAIDALPDHAITP